MFGLISRIVEVLHSRGYLSDPEAPRKVVDEAVKSFQNWAGLPPSGELTPETQDAINAPRICGLPDMIPMTMDATKLCKWEDNRIAYFLTAAFPGLTMEESWKAFDWAMAQWAEAGFILPSRATTQNNARIIASMKRIDGPNGVLAQSELPCGGIAQAHQEYDSSEAWDRSIKAKLVALHELGHALGIGHIGSGNVMAPTYNASLVTLQAGDIAEIVKRYGNPPTTPIPPIPPTPIPGGHVDVNWETKRVTVFGQTGWTIAYASSKVEEVADA